MLTSVAGFRGRQHVYLRHSWGQPATDLLGSLCRLGFYHAFAVAGSFVDGSLSHRHSHVVGFAAAAASCVVAASSVRFMCYACPLPPECTPSAFSLPRQQASKWFCALCGVAFLLLFCSFLTGCL